MTQANPMPATTSIAQWFGSNRMLAARVGRELDGCSWLGIPFAGGCCEVAHIRARTIAVNDRHKHLINMARVIADPKNRAELVSYLRWKAFHPDALDRAQLLITKIESAIEGDRSALFDDRERFEIFSNLSPGKVEWAAEYFICCWMTRSGSAGTDSELTAGLSTRWNASGGDSVVRYHSAIGSLKQWGRILRRCTFTEMDVFDFLPCCVDGPETGIYCDPPFPGPGDKYRHRFDEAKHRRLARSLAGFSNARVVCRFYDHELIRELYPRPRWTWIEQTGRKQTNGSAPEVLLVNGESYTAGKELPDTNTR